MWTTLLRLAGAWWWIAVCFAAGVYWHWQAGLTLPFPCGDEVVFYYPAQALAQHGTLESPHLDPHRAHQWMPPGYMAVLAAWVNAFGTGLVAARWMSFALALAAFIGFWRFWACMGLPTIGLLLVGVAFLSRHWVTMGNMVRMEGLLLCMIWLLLWALWKGKTGLAVGLGLISLSIHPNALYFLIAIPLLAGLAPSWSLKGRLNGWALGLGFAVVAGYGWYVCLHMQDFIHDWRWQAATRSSEGWRILALRPDQAVFWAALLVLGFWVYATKDKKRGFVLLTAVVFWAMRIIGQGWAYGIYTIIALTLVLGVGLFWAKNVAWPWLAKRIGFSQKKEWMLSFLSILCLIAGLSKADIYTWPLVDRNAYYWMGMPMQHAAEPYLTEMDKKEVLARLHKLLPNRLNKVYFVPEGEGIFIAPEDTGRVVHVMPVFGENLPDYVVAHRSPLSAFYDLAFQETCQMLPPGTPLPAPFYSRNGTENWYLFPVINNKYPPFILLKGDPILENLKLKMEN